MPLNMLNQYIDIVKTLTENGPLSVHELAQFLKVNPTSLKKPVKFLADQGMIKKKKDNIIVIYSVATRGKEVLKFFKVQTFAKVAIESSRK